MPLSSGTRLGLYEIKSVLGAGGMGEVYCALDTRLNRDVAIKVLPELMAAHSERLARFEREAQLLASLNHPHIAQLYGFEDWSLGGSSPARVRALVMELVDGPTLADRIADGPMPLDEVLPIARQIAEALETAHERGIIHRDLKPANIKLTAKGAWIGFVRNAKLYKMPAGGGDALVVCNLQGGPGVTWGSDGRIIFSRAWLSGLSVVSADGGTPTVITNPDRSKNEIGHWWPTALPDGRVLFTVVNASIGLNDARIALLDPATSTYQVLFPGAKPLWLPSGHIVFYRAGRYHVVPFDLSSSRVTGEPFAVLEDAQELDPAGDWGQAVAVASSGLLTYLPGHYVPPSRLTWIDTQGSFTPLAFTPRPFVNVRLSPDGRRVATASLEGGRLLIRLFDLDRGTEEMPNIDGMNWNPVWLPDGRLSFTSMRKGDFDVYVKEVGSSGAERALLNGPDDTDPIAWTRDGRLVFQGSEPDGAYPLKLFDPRQPTQITRLTEHHVDNGGSLSPDDRWLAYQSAALGRSVVYVRPLGASGAGIALSRDSEEFPTFLHDGKTLALVRGRQLVARSWRDVGGRFEIGPERAVAPLAFGSGWTYGAPYDVTPDGRFLALVRTEPPVPPRIRVVLGWDREVNRLRGQDRQ